MTCPECSTPLDIPETRRLKSADGMEFVRRVRVCDCGYRLVTHEIPVSCSPIPDTYRPRRNRVEYNKKYYLQCKAKKKEKQKTSWLDRINEKLATI